MNVEPGLVLSHGDGPLTVIALCHRDEYAITLSQRRGWEMWLVHQLQGFEPVSHD